MLAIWAPIAIWKCEWPWPVAVHLTTGAGISVYAPGPCAVGQPARARNAPDDFYTYTTTLKLHSKSPKQNELDLRVFLTKLAGALPSIRIGNTPALK